MVRSDPSPGQPRGRRPWMWPAILIGLLAVHAAVWMGFAIIAVRDPFFAVESDHYRKALAWDETSAELRRSRELGWTVTIETEAGLAVDGSRRLVCHIADRNGGPVEHARVEIEAFPHARANDRLEMTLAEEGNGTYGAAVPMERAGLWEYRLTVHRGDETFRHVALHELAARERR